MKAHTLYGDLTDPRLVHSRIEAGFSMVQQDDTNVKLVNAVSTPPDWTGSAKLRAKAKLKMDRWHRYCALRRTQSAYYE